jgi:hypothetical protein
MRVVILAVLIAIACGSAIAQDSPDEYSPEAVARAQQSVSRLANIQMNWGAKMNSPAASITVKETSRKSTGQQTVVFYRVFTSGMPGQGLHLVVTPFNLQSMIATNGVTLDDSGQAMTSGSALDLGVVAAKGEPKRFSLVSDDGQVKAFFYIMPFPVTETDHGCSVERTLLLQHAEAVLIQGLGFPTNSTVHVKASSETEVHEGDLKADASGNVSTVFLPFVNRPTVQAALLCRRKPVARL